MIKIAQFLLIPFVFFPFDIGIDRGEDYALQLCLLRSVNI
jgi:hypothetical protein